MNSCHDGISWSHAGFKIVLSFVIFFICKIINREEEADPGANRFHHTKIHDRQTRGLNRGVFSVQSIVSDVAQPE